jgi:hypothetical protein
MVLADKGNPTVILDFLDYLDEINTLLVNPTNRIRIHNPIK